MKIAIYSRKSVYIEGSVSIQTQIEMCKDYANRKYDNPVFEVFEDEGYSGGNTNRPAFQKLLRMVELSKINVVMCYKVDRIARNTLDFLNTLDMFKNNGVDLISISEGFDPNTQIGKMMLTLLASFAEMERANIQQRVKDNMLSIAKKGKWTGGSAPIGFKIGIEGGLELENRELIENIYKMKYENYKNSDIINKIQNEFGHKFCNSTLSTTLKKPLYVNSSKDVSTFLTTKGYTVLGEENNINGYLTYTDDNIKYAVVSDIEGIVEGETWLKVNKDIAEKNFRGTNRFNKDYWLTKTLVCPVCGKTYAGHTKKWNKKYTLKDGTEKESSNTYYYYMCRDMLRGKLKECTNTKRIKKERIESTIEDYIYLLKNKDNFSKLYNVNNKNNKEKIKRLEKTLKNKETSLNNLVDKLSMFSSVASAALIKKIESISSEINIIKDEITRMELEDMNNVKDNKTLVINNIKAFKRSMSVEEKRICVMNIFSKIIYDPISDTFKVYFV